MVLKKISEHFWMLQSDDGLVKLTWFGATKGEVLGRFSAYIRSVDLDRIRHHFRDPAGNGWRRTGDQQ